MKGRIFKALMAVAIVIASTFSTVSQADAASGSYPYKSNFRVSQAYNSSTHTGIDLVGDNKTVVSITDGKVVLAGWENANNHSQGFGQRVWVQTGNDFIAYGHLSSINVTNGQTVSKGTVIGTEGSTGTSTGSHLHLEIRVGSTSSSTRKNAADYIGISNTYGAVITPSSTKPSVIYRVRRNGSWLPAVTNNTDYAGVIGASITDVSIQVTSGSIKYRVHVKGGSWLPYVTGYNINDANNGYAGNGKVIDAVEAIYTPQSGKSYKLYYKVSPLNSGYLANGTYSLGKAIDRLQMWIQ